MTTGLTLTIDTGSEAMSRLTDVAHAVQVVAEKIDSGQMEGAILDGNGNTRGSFKLELPPADHANVFDRIMDWDSQEALMGRYPAWRLRIGHQKFHVGSLSPQRFPDQPTSLRVRDSSRGYRSQYRGVVLRNVNDPECHIQLEVMLPGKARYQRVAEALPHIVNPEENR